MKLHNPGTAMRRLRNGGEAGIKADGPDTPAMGSPFPAWPSFTMGEIEAAAEVLRSGKVNYWTGQEGRKFEDEFAEFCGCRHAVALANGTVALELALYALGIGPGDEVITTSRTFIASASAIVMRGATPVLADVDPASQNLTVETVRRVLTSKTRAIIAVHLAGWPCDMDPLKNLAEEHGLKIVEDCAQAHGATYKGKRVGSLGDAAAFSFCQDKIMTTGGEGGMLTTSDPAVWARAWSFKDHGKGIEALSGHGPTSGFRWLHHSFGTNWRMTEMQSAIGRVMLSNLPSWLAVRRQNAAVLTEAFRRIPGLRVTEPPSHVGHAYYKYYTFVQPELLAYGWSRDRIIESLNAMDIPCFSGSCSEIYLEKAFLNAGFGPPARLAVAEELGRTSLMFLVHPTLTESDMRKVARAVEVVFSSATRKTTILS